MSTIFTTRLPDPLRGEIWLGNFDPTIGAETRKQRPAVVNSIPTVGRLSLRVVTPITDWKPHDAELSWFVHLPPEPENGLTKESGADAFEVKSLSINRFIRHLSAIRDEQVAEIAAGVALCIGYMP